MPSVGPELSRRENSESSRMSVSHSVARVRDRARCCVRCAFGVLEGGASPSYLGFIAEADQSPQRATNRPMTSLFFRRSRPPPILSNGISS